MKRVRSWIEDKMLEWADKIDESRQELKFNREQHIRGSKKCGYRPHVIIVDDPMLLAPRLPTDRDIPNTDDLEDHVAPPLPLGDLVINPYRGTDSDPFLTNDDAVSEGNEEFWK